MLVDLAPGTAQVRIADHFDAVQPFDSGGQAKLFGAGVADAGLQTPVVAEVAEADRRPGAARWYQHHAVHPDTGGLGLTLIEHAPGDIDQRPFLGGLGNRDGFDDQIGRRRQLDRHRQ